MVSESFKDCLEKKARKIAERTLKNTWEDSLEGILGREITLVVESLDQERGMAQEAQKELSKLESYVSTDIMRLVPPGRFYHDANIDRRGRLKRRLLDLHRERLRLRLEREERVQKLQKGLLELVEEHSQLTMENGDRKNSRKARTSHS